MIGINGTISGSGGAGTIEESGGAGTRHHHDGEITERTTASGTAMGATGHGFGAAGDAMPIKTRDSENGASNADNRLPLLERYSFVVQ